MTDFQINFRWLAASIAMLCGYSLINYSQFALIDVQAFLPSINWPWGLKFTLMLYSLLLLLIFKLANTSFRVKDAGFTFQQNSGAIKIGLLVLLALLVLRYYMSFVLGSDDGVLDPEELSFILFAHPLDKELFYHGVLLYALSQAISGKTWRLFGCSITFAAAITCLLFALHHSVVINPAHSYFLPVAFAFNSFHALVYLWLRIRSGSLVLPVIAHGVVLFFSQHL